MFRIGAKIRVGRETGNTGIFFFGLMLKLCYKYLTVAPNVVDQ